MAVMAVRHQFEFARAAAFGRRAAQRPDSRRARARPGRASHAMKDPTRGGVASALHEMAAKSGVGIVARRGGAAGPAAVRAAADLLGIDPLLIANEGKARHRRAPAAVEAVLAALRAHPLRRATPRSSAMRRRRISGPVVRRHRFRPPALSEPEGELLPRIC